MCGLSELRICVDREVRLVSHCLSRSSPVPYKPYGLCGRKAHNKDEDCQSAGTVVKVEVAVLGPPVPNKPYGLCGREATLNLNKVCVSDPRSCVKVEVAVSVDVKQH